MVLRVIELLSLQSALNEIPRCAGFPVAQISASIFAGRALRRRAPPISQRRDLPHGLVDGRVY